jgi:hypothetical protein
MKMRKPLLSKMEHQFLFIMLMLAQAGCKKIAEPDPPVSLIIGAQAYATNTSAIAIVNSMYSYMSQQNNFAQGTNSVGLLTGLTGDELQPAPIAKYLMFYTNTVQPALFSPNYFWYDSYTNIYTCNAALQEMPGASGMTEPVKKQLIGEVRFLRAFFYFYLVNLFGDVPLSTITDYRINNRLTRTPASQIYGLILQDLTESQADLSADFVNGFLTKVPERIRPTKWAAAALLARVHLYLQNWVAAEAQASLVLKNMELMLEPDLNRVFLSSSKEAILQLETQANRNTLDGFTYILRPTGPDAFVRPVSLRPEFRSRFEPGDNRLIQWIGQVTVPASGTFRDTTFYFPYKYKIGYNPPPTTTGEYLMVLRLAEQYLIRAEARAQQGNLSGAKEDLNAIRTRAALPETSAATQQELLEAIAHERQVELFTEWGHRWLDLKRTGAMDSVMTRVAVEKGTEWQPYYKLFPIPQYEIEQNPNLTQNSGY